MSKCTNPTSTSRVLGKLEAGKNVSKVELRPRGLGQSNVIEFGQDPYRRYHKTDDELLALPVPTAPTFAEDLEGVRERAAHLAQKAPIRKTLSNPHPLIAGLLVADEKRKEEIAKSRYGFALDKPLFDTPLEKRRLKILNSLFLALAHCGCTPSIQGKEAKELYVRVGDVSLSFKLGSHAEVLEQAIGRQKAQSNTQERLTLKISLWEKSSDIQTQWEDTDGKKLEEQMESILLGMLVSGEWMYRASRMRSFTYEIERRQKIEAEIQRKTDHAENAKREQIAKLKKDKHRQLVTEMLSWRRANNLREYIAARLHKAHESGDGELIGKAEQWAKWANAEADEIDPLQSLT